MLEEFESDKDITCVYYKDYGAVGDGKTDDTAAIRAAHQDANEGNQVVYGEKGKTYLITKCSKPIEIKCQGAYSSVAHFLVVLGGKSTTSFSTTFKI